MSGWIRAVGVCAFGVAAMLLTSSPVAAQVRVGVAIGAPFVAAPVVVAPQVIAPVAPYYAPYAYSPYYYSPYAYTSPYWGGYYGLNFSFGSYGRRYYAPRGYVYRGGGRRHHR